MGLRELIFGASNRGNDENKIDHYRVSHQRNGSGWKPVEGYDDLDEPITKTTFEYNEAPLDLGQYKLFAVKNNLHTQLPDGEGWKLTVEDDTSEEPQPTEELIRELREQVEEIKADQEQPDDVEQMIEKKKAAAALQVLQNPTFIQEHGDKIALSMLDAESNIETSDWEAGIDSINSLNGFPDAFAEGTREESETS